MSIKNWFKWFRKKSEHTPEYPERLDIIVQKLAQTHPHEISCDDVHMALAEFTEMQRQGEEVAHLMPLVQQHLEMCRECYEEYESLMLALDAEAQLMG